MTCSRHTYPRLTRADVISRRQVLRQLRRSGPSRGWLTVDFLTHCTVCGASAIVRIQPAKSRARIWEIAS